MKAKQLVTTVSNLIALHGDVDVHVVGTVDSFGVAATIDAEVVSYSEACPDCENRDCPNAQPHIRVEGPQA